MPESDNSAEFQWLTSGDAAYSAMLAAIGRARRSICFETYIFAAGSVGDSFRQALAAAAQRGLQVRVLLDAFGSFGLAGDYWEPLVAAGGEFRWFNPLSFKRFMFRDHRKVLICDDACAFVGGFNVAEEYAGDGVRRGWRDVGLRLGGALSRKLAEAFDRQYERANQPHLGFTQLRRADSLQILVCAEGELLLSGPGRGRNGILHYLLDDLQHARHVQIIAAYFLPTGRLRRALVRVARRGGMVELILPLHSDVPLSVVASQAHYQRYLRRGMRLFEYLPQVLHSKLIVFDHAVYVGSANLDARSMHINYELMVRITEPEVVAGARAVFADHQVRSREIQAARWRASRDFWTKVKERWASFLLGRLDPLVMRWQMRRLTGGLQDGKEE